MRRFLHLSDIHFNPSPGEPERDIDLIVRDDLLQDLRNQAERINPVDAVLVVGDLAASGTADQYQLAREFLDEVCAIVGCDPTRIACVPGNHDIDRTAHGPLHDGLRRLLRTIPTGDISARIEQILTDPAAAEVIHESLEHYNRFALPLGWAVTASHPIPEGWDMPLGQHTLRIRGVNSALICDKTDDHEHDCTRLALGTSQLAQLGADQNTITLLMCHHPRRWLRDEQHVDPWLARPHILLTGHEHEAGIELHDDGRSLTIASGAVNPERNNHNWQPAYNILELDTDETNLTITILARAYPKKRTGFDADERWPNGKTVPIPLQRHTPPGPQPPGPPIPTAPPVTSDERAMIYAILTASPDTREAAARTLGLLHDAEELRTSNDEAQLLARARNAEALHALAEAVSNA
jgi:predicted phosphodiesterase